MPPIAGSPEAIIGVSLLPRFFDREERPVELDGKRAPPRAGVHETLQDIAAGDDVALVLPAQRRLDGARAADIDPAAIPKSAPPGVMGGQRLG